MVNQQLLDYIKSQLEDGVSKEVIKSNLLQNGWADADIEETFLLAVTPAPLAPQPSVLEPEVSSTISTPASFAGIGSLMSHAWSTYVGRFWTLISIAFVLSFAPVFALIIPIVSGNAVLQIVLNILLYVLILWSGVSMLYAIIDGIGIIESYRKGLHKLLSYWWILLLSIFILIGGYMLLFIPGIIFSVWFMFAFFVLVSEEVRGMDALMKSKEYVRGRWWGVFGRLLSLLIPVIIFSLLLGASLSFLGFSNESLVFKIVSSVVSVFITPFFVAYIFSLYKNLKEIKGEFVFEPKGKGKFIAVGVLGAIIISLTFLAPVILVSLNTAREKGQDALRKVEINTLNTEIIFYSNKKGAPPQSLGELVVSGQDDDKIRDDVTNEIYKYRIGQGDVYSLCAIQNSGKKYCVGDMEPSEGVPEDISLLPKYGGVKKTQAQLNTDREFVDGVVKELGSRKAAYMSAFLRGTTALQEGDFDMAMRRFNQAWLIDPKAPDAYLGMATVESARKNPDSAEVLLMEGLSYNETNALLRCNLALSYLIRLKSVQDETLITSYFAQAKQEIEKALTYEPDNVECKQLQSILKLNQ